jgi:hypothetical protein
MSGGKRSLRYSTEAEMPEGMRTAYRAALDKLCSPGPSFYMDNFGKASTGEKPIEIITEHPPCVMLHKTTAVGKTEVLVPGGFMPGKATRANKYNAKPTTVDGIRFDSKREAAYYCQLKLRVHFKEVAYFLRQVPIHLPGGTRLVVDFLEVHTDGSLHYVDVKGRETDAFKIKRREIQAVYPIVIELA